MISNRFTEQQLADAREAGDRPSIACLPYVRLVRCAVVRGARADASSHPSFAGRTGARLPRVPDYWKTTIPVSGETDDGGGGPLVLIVPPSNTPEPLIVNV